MLFSTRISNTHADAVHLVFPRARKVRPRTDDGDFCGDDGGCNIPSATVGKILLMMMCTGWYRSSFGRSSFSHCSQLSTHACVCRLIPIFCQSLSTKQGLSHFLEHGISSVSIFEFLGRFCILNGIWCWCGEHRADFPKISCSGHGA